MREPLYALLWILALMAFLAGMTLLTIGCGARAPGDPIGWYRPEELVTICHAEFDPRGPGFGPPPVLSSLNFNHSRAEWHLRHHKFDHMGGCQT